MKKIFVMLVIVLGLGSLQSVFAEIESRENSSSNELAAVRIRSNVTLKGSDGVLNIYTNGSFSFIDKGDNRSSGTYSIYDSGTSIILHFTYPTEGDISCSCKMSGGTLLWVKKNGIYYR